METETPKSRRRNALSNSTHQEAASPRAPRVSFTLELDPSVAAWVLNESELWGIESSRLVNRVLAESMDRHRTRPAPAEWEDPA